MKPPLPLEHSREPTLPGRKPLRLGALSNVWHPRLITFALIALIVILALGLVSIGVGDYPLSPWNVIRIIMFDDGTRVERLVVWEWRIPRILCAIFVGAALGMSGAITQAITHNGLASPDILGITTGASAAVVTVLTNSASAGVSAWLTLAGIPLAAFVGALGSAALIWLLAWRRSTDPFRLVLIGIIITALLSSYITYAMVRAQIHDAARAQYWLTGSLVGADWLQVATIAVVVTGFLPFIPSINFHLKASTLGEPLARSLGQRFRRTQMTMLLASIILAAAAVSVSGPIGFIAFVSPHLAQRLCDTDTPPVFTSGLAGAAVLLSADFVTQAVLPVELPVGIVTAVIGGMFLLYLIIAHNRKTNVCM